MKNVKKKTNETCQLGAVRNPDDFNEKNIFTLMLPLDAQSCFGALNEGENIFSYELILFFSITVKNTPNWQVSLIFNSFTFSMKKVMQ